MKSLSVKKIATIHDIVGIGRCAMSATLPIISANGVQCCPIVTCVLSSHLGGYGKTSFSDLTQTFSDSFEHYKRLDYKFDMIYTGFFSSVEQIKKGIEFINYFGDIPVLVDPVMGDDGKAYDTYTEDRIAAMRDITKMATIITPNVTEAELLLQEKIPTNLSFADAKEYFYKLNKMGPKKVIITSFPININDKTEYFNIAFDSIKEKFYAIKGDFIRDDSGNPTSYPGTGDIFASILSASLLNGLGVAKSMEKATKFLDLVIHKTHELSEDIREGISFEPYMSWLAQKHHLNDYMEL